MKKIRIAFIKYGGLTAGGSEKLLQIIAANLPKDLFDVTYFYCDRGLFLGSDSVQALTDSDRVNYMLKNNVKLVKFSVPMVDLTSPFHNWLGTDFFSFFKEEEFDIVQTCRSGHKEFPFVRIKNVPIVDIIALSSGSDNQYNISRVIHLCNWSKDSWVKRGGDISRAKIISLPINTEDDEGSDMVKFLGLDNKFVFGMHQRVSDDIFSDVVLEAYSKIETQNTYFILMGGSNKYKLQAKDLKIKNILFLDSTGDLKVIFKFLRTLDVYSHGRKDGEVNSQAIAEALYTGLPIVSHKSKINNGHIECIGNAGKVVNNVFEYGEEMKKLISDRDYFLYRSNWALKVFGENYELNGQINKYIKLYQDVYTNPFPNKISRLLSSLNYTQNIRVVFVFIYLKLRFLIK